jgi:hypothetical protein
MRYARFSVSDLLCTVVFCAVCLTCLKFASSLWADAFDFLILGLLTLAVLGVFYRRGERRGYWAGFALFGWTYLALSSAPRFVDTVRPKLVTSKLLDRAYPWVIPAVRQPSHTRYDREQFVLPAAVFQDGLTVEELKTAPIDVWVTGEGAQFPALLVEGVRTASDPRSDSMIMGTVLDVDRDQNARLAEAKAYSRQFVLRRHTPNPISALSASPPVKLEDFQKVGHFVFGLLAAWIGSIMGRYFFATRDETRSSRLARPERSAEGGLQ